MSLMEIDDVRRPCLSQLAARVKRLAWISAKTAAVSTAPLPPWAVLGWTCAECYSQDCEPSLVSRGLEKYLVCGISNGNDSLEMPSVEHMLL